MKYVVCDDEKIQVDLVCKYIQEYAQKNKQKTEIYRYYDCHNLWWDLESGLKADLLLLDIQMEDLNGIELARLMRKNQFFHMLCFISGSKEYVFEGYDVDAIAYLLKPYEKDQLFRVLDKAQKLVQNTDDFNIIQTKKEMYKIYHRDLIALEAFLHDTKIYLRSSASKPTEIIIHQSLKEVAALFNLSLFQIHRSYMVNLKNILQVRKTECIAENNLCFPIARGNYELTMQAFIEANRGSL